MSRVFIGLIHFYRYFFSPWVGNSCRFYPTCSHYSEEAIRRHGVIKGLALTIWRIVRCNPWSAGGIDYVPGCDCVDHQTDHNKNSAQMRGEARNEV